MKTQDLERLERLKVFAKKYYPKLPYHNYEHALDVWNVARKYSIVSQLDFTDRFYLESASLLHDVVYVVGSSDNEEKSVEFAKKYLPLLDYSQKEIDSVSGLILATKWPTEPKSFLEELICDADLDNLGRPDFLDKSYRLLTEWGVPEDSDWYRKQLQLLENNHYYSLIANNHREKGKKENIRLVQDILRQHEENELVGGKKC